MVSPFVGVLSNSAFFSFIYLFSLLICNLISDAPKSNNFFYDDLGFEFLFCNFVSSTKLIGFYPTNFVSEDDKINRAPPCHYPREIFFVFM